ncbi:hypothetical protein G6O67_004173 [Ophiocordyceps sinensis]|uniref:Fe2OG dioxygenase domain-containing protein n=1 Tax=Ophiocordyceps sinensis TaxID=72228 RepID=A0A8H4LZE2_9HYPO|nr:hypothetical protein G6O67_004173 [Ophiocordyceps sinensis]
MAQPASDNGSAEELLADISTALASVGNKQLFAIGGKLATGSSARPVVLRWDTALPNCGRRLSFPVTPAQQPAFEQLCQDCEPATFGLGHQEIYDEAYRKAVKMDEQRFCTTFDPNDCGLMDSVIQALLHGARGDARYRGIRAEMYKLNVYSGPSGRFKAHVDTPRGGDHMGSLVVCLPYSHQGGQLVVRHGGRESVFDWASDDAHSVRWAAFFADCEHEVLEVTRGHRVTLTYNLYWTTYGPSFMSRHLAGLELDRLPFFHVLERLVNSAEVQARGATLGFTCTHSYPHASKSSIRHLSHCLKGLDMVVYQALVLLAGSARVTAVLDDTRQQDEESICSSRPSSPAQAAAGRNQDEESSELRLLAQTSQAVLHNGRFPDPSHVYRENNPYQSPLDPETIVRDEGLAATVDGGDQSVLHTQTAYERRAVTWLNHRPDSETPKELALAFATYGNEPEVTAYYTSAAIIATIQPRKRRPDL